MKRIEASRWTRAPSGFRSSEGYDIIAQYAERITSSGVYVHSAPWSVDSQGNANVSHGCINLGPDNAAWYYDVVHVGDPVIVQP